MPTITLQPITAHNWLAALDLTVRPEQQAFVPTVALSLAKAYIQPNGFTYDPFGLYRRQLTGKQLVGFFSLIYLPDEPTFCYIGGFLIDQQFQRQGYGRAALAQIVHWVRAELPSCRSILLSVHPENRVAERLYTAAGFVRTGQWLAGEAEMKLVL